MKQYIIWDNNAHTMALAESLVERMDGTVTIIDSAMKGIKASGHVAYASADYVDAIKELGFPVIQYKHRIKGVNQAVWYEVEETEYVH